MSAKPDIRILTKELAEKRFDNIFSSIKKGMTPKEIHSIVHTNLESGFIHILPLQSPFLKLYRVTVPYDGFNEMELKSYSFPPDKNKVTTQRANIDEYPVFYSSLEPITSILETEKVMSNGGSFYISEWELDLTSGIKIHSLLYSEIALQSKSLNELVMAHEKMISSLVVNPDEKLIEGFKYSVKRIADTFLLEEEDNYLFSSAYAHYLMHDTYHETNGVVDIPVIMYPSVKDKSGGVNLAIHPRVSNSKQLNLIRTFEVVLNTKDESAFSIDLLKRSQFNGNESAQFHEQLQFTITNYDILNSKIVFKDGGITDSQSIINVPLNEVEFDLKDYLLGNVRDTVINELKKYSPKEELENPWHFEGNTYQNTVHIVTNETLSIGKENAKRIISKILIPITWKNEWVKTV